MPKTHLLLAMLAFAGVATANQLRADGPPDANSAETRLRDALRTTMLQLRDAQGQIVTIQAAEDQSEKDKADLNAKVDALNAKVTALMDQAAADKAASDKSIADLKQSNNDLVVGMVNGLSARLISLEKPGTDDKGTLLKAVTGMKTSNPDLAKALDQYDTDIELWVAGYDKYVQFANKTEAERSKLAVQVILLQRVVADRETKNLELYKTGNEILDRYEGFSLGDALGAKEPFIGISRVKLQEFVQDYKDKLTAQKISIGQAPSAATPAAPSTNNPPVSGVNTAKQ